MPIVAGRRPRPGGWLRPLGIGLFVSVVVLALGAVALLTMYLNRISDASSALSRVDSLGSYEGRPTPVAVDGVNAINYLLTTAGSDGELDAVLIAHLSASRRSLTLVAVPSDLRVGNTTLAASHEAGPMLVARDLEGLTGARMDYQVQVDLQHFAPVVDAIGGTVLDGRRLSGQQVLAALELPDAGARSVATADLLRATLAAAAAGSVIVDPSRFDNILDALTPCLKVDANFTDEQIKATLVESRVHAAEIATVSVAVARESGVATADAAALERLRWAFATDDFTGLK